MGDGANRISYVEGGESLPMNETITNQDVEMNVPSEEQHNKGINKNAGDSSLQQRITRNMIKRQEKHKIFMKIEDPNEQEYLISLHQDMEKNDTLSYESFYGVYKFLMGMKDASKDPIIFVIKNIKNFP